jgi:hypothetical protein
VAREFALGYFGSSSCLPQRRAVACGRLQFGLLFLLQPGIRLLRLGSVTKQNMRLLRIHKTHGIV